MNIQLEKYNGPSPVIRPMNKTYEPKRAEAFNYEPAKLSERQAVFLRNLITIAEHLERNTISVRFKISGRGEFFLDRGCIKIAEHAGFIQPLQDGPSGYVETVELSFSV